MPFLMIRNDITKVATDAIVNPANRNLLQGSGTSRAIYQAAGEQELTAACEAIDLLKSAGYAFSDASCEYSASSFFGLGSLVRLFALK